ncbi:hypothetical protein [Xanthomonas campestris]|uniref:hypothetical protein n=1 Tax=Xanthomonas campestris TaxID=339 RepID=UPI00094AC949|nr:hypothetical protein Xcc1_14700 [Xanthomonas campestris pv. campestris]
MKVVQVSWRNIAPSADDPERDVCSVSIAADSATPLWFEQSLLGGHAERDGGSMWPCMRWKAGAAIDVRT